MKEFWTTLASVMGAWAFIQTLLHTVFPPELRFASLNFFHRFFICFSTYCYYDITEIDGVNTNELYNAVQLYLSSSASVIGNRLSLTRGVNSSAITFGLTNNDCHIDTYQGITVLWEHVVTQRQSQSFSWRPLPEEKRWFILRVKKKDKGIILNSYFDFVMEKSDEIHRKNQDRLIYTNSRGQPWESVPFKHPSTFDTLAMDPVKKSEIKSDLRDFANGESFYQKTGRAWKRGYLLYGPPGTGKSSMIAAMANYLGYDIYDLELSEAQTNSELRNLLMKTSSKSIIVIEDIDCSLNLTNRKKSTNGTQVSRSGFPAGFSGKNGGGGDDSGENSITLSGLLNFTDGLWSCCGSERIFVFTTNHIEKLDAALLRSGRMDMHVHMSYCSYPSLKILLKNYLGCENGDLEKDLKDEMKESIGNARMTPADISEVLIKNRGDKGNALKELLEVLKIRANNVKSMEMNGVGEQVKRALENPGIGDVVMEESCEKIKEDGDQDDDNKIQ